MRTPHAFALTGLLAAAVVAGLALCFMQAPQPAPTPAPMPINVSAPVPQPEPEPVVKTYSNAAYGFSVAYADPVQPTEDMQDMQLSGYIPVCEPEHAVVCFPYDRSFYAGTNFEAAALAVHVRADLKKASSCEAAAPQSGETADGEATINGTIFKKFAFGDAAAGHRLEGERYRAFRDGRCFELATSVASSVFENYEPGAIEPFTDDQRSSLQGLLDAMLTSFRFGTPQT